MTTERNHETGAVTNTDPPSDRTRPGVPYRPWRKGMTPTQIVAQEEWLEAIPACDCIVIYGCHAPDCPLVAWHASEIAAAIAAEREECAKVADAFCLAEKRDDCPRCPYYPPGTFCPECRDPRNIAAEIRARGEA